MRVLHVQIEILFPVLRTTFPGSLRRIPVVKATAKRHSCGECAAALPLGIPVAIQAASTCDHQGAGPEFSFGSYVHENWRRAEYWRTNRWRNVAGRPIENSDLWRELLSIRSKLRIRTDIEWTLGKKAPILKAVDKSAKSAAKSPTTTDRGYRPGKVGRTRNRTSGAATLFPASGQDALIRIYQTGAFANGENKIKFQLFSDMRGDFFEKFIGYASPEIGALLHRHHSYRVRFNSDPKYPTIVAVIEEVV